MTDVRVLVVDDETLTAEAHAEYVRRLDGFELAGVATSGTEAIRMLRDSAAESPHVTASFDLVLLDFTMPDLHGLDVCRRIRAAGLEIDVIAITAVRDVKTVRQAVSLGVVQYLIKPFTFRAFADKMQGYLAFRHSFDEASGATTQRDIDRGIASLRTPGRETLPTGLAGETLDRVIALLRTSEGLSASEIAARLNLSRVTARRYVEHLADSGVVERGARYGAPGRPEVEFRWVSTGRS